MDARVLRWEVPVDDQDHAIELGKYLTISKTGCWDPETVEFWGVYLSTDPPIERTFRVFATGQPIPNGYTYVGTACPIGFPDGGRLVWHLFERMSA